MGLYATQEEITAFAQEASPDPEVWTQLAGAASRFFDKLCEVPTDFFAAAGGTFTARTFYGDGTAYLRLDPYTALNTVTPVVIVDADNVSQEVPEYYERNGFLVIKGYGDGIPTRDVSGNVPVFIGTGNPIDLTFWNNPFMANGFRGWPSDLKVTVSAKWGFTEIPADVKQAVIQLAIHLWRMSDPAFTAISQSGQPYQPPAIPNQVQAIADTYKGLYSQGTVFA